MLSPTMNKHNTVSKGSNSFSCTEFYQLKSMALRTITASILLDIHFTVSIEAFHTEQ